MNRERFEVIVIDWVKCTKGSSEVFMRIIRDKVTGVNYLLCNSTHSHASGLTVLLDRDGKPVAT